MTGVSSRRGPIMFGYVLPVKPDMRVRDYETYRAIYCGLCKQLGKSYGVLSRFLLNYDLVLLALLADALSGKKGVFRHEGCFANPVARHPILHDTPGLMLAADSLILLSWHKLRDNLQDEKGPKRVVYGCASPALSGMHRRAAARHPALSEELGAQMERQRALEAANCANVDEACEPTAQMCAAIFRAAAATPGQEKILARLGLFCGQIIYLLDAAEDLPDDTKNSRYNVFASMGFSPMQAAAAAKRRCGMAAGEIALCYNLLETTMYKDILDNIFFLGLPAAIGRAGIKRTKGKPHGQIESLPGAEST